MTSLYNKVYNLCHQWLSTEEEDYITFTEWIQDKMIYLNGRLHSPTIQYKNHINASLLNNPQNATITATNDYIQITTSTSGEKKVNTPFSFNSATNCFIEWTYVSGGTTQPIAFSMNSSSNSATGGYFSYNGTSFSFVLGTSTTLTRTVNNGDKITVVRYNGDTEVYHNGVIIHKATKSFSGNVMFGFYTNKSRVQRLKDIRVGTL